MKLADESMLFWTMYGPSRARTSRNASPSRRATSNIDVTFQTLCCDSPVRACCSRMLIAFCVTDRLPDDSITITRSASRANTRIFEKRAIWSTPAFVRESDAKIIPASSDMATQYVMRKQVKTSLQVIDLTWIVADEASVNRLARGTSD